MRLELELGFDDRLVLPIHYNHIVQGFIYNNIEDDIFRTFLHDEGFQYEKRSFKFFTFSRLLGRFQMNTTDGTITFAPPIKLIVSSAVDEFIENFANSVIKKDDLFLGKTSVYINSISAYDYKRDCSSGIITMLSPMVTYSTVTLMGKKKTIYHSPSTEIFNKLIYENLSKKYEIIYGQQPDEKFSIEPLNDRDIKMNIIKYHDLIIKGWMGKYRIEGQPELIKIAYETGLGSKNSQGFGCFIIIPERR